MTTAIIIALVIAVVTLLCVNRILRDDLNAAQERTGKYVRWYEELSDVVAKEREERSSIDSQYKGVCKMLELAEERRVAFEQERCRLAGCEAAAVELTRQIKERVQPMILIMRPMLDALERMDLPDFEWVPVEPSEERTP
jgi:hypothetical protein